MFWGGGWWLAPCPKSRKESHTGKLSSSIDHGRHCHPAGPLWNPHLVPRFWPICNRSIPVTPTQSGFVFWVLWSIGFQSLMQQFDPNKGKKVFMDSFVTNLLWQTVFFSLLLLLTTNENFLQFFSYFSYRRISWKYFLFDVKCVLWKLIWFLFGFSVERKAGFAVDWFLCCILLGFRAPCSCIHTLITDLWNSFFSFLLFLIL